MEFLFDGEQADFIFQQDGASPHWSLIVRQYLNATLHSRWIGRAGNDDCMLLHWPPRSPDLTSCEFFLWGYVKDLVYVPPLPTSVDDLKTRITEALITIDLDTLVRVWQDMEYRFDVYRVTKARILNICEKFNKTFISLIFAFKFFCVNLRTLVFSKKNLVFIPPTVI